MVHEEGDRKGGLGSELAHVTDGVRPPPQRPDNGKLDENRYEDRHERGRDDLEDLQRDLGKELHGGHGHDSNDQHPQQLVAALPAAFRGLVMERMKLRHANDNGETVAKSNHDWRGQQENESREIAGTGRQHKEPCEHDGGEEQFDMFAVATWSGRRREKGGDDRSKSTGRPIYHSRPAPEETAEESDDPGRMQCHMRPDVGQEGKRHRLRHLSKADGHP
mmetsp:Transcript_27084/g.55836  ORF Transcript_27084/g.55836 Transcript_27084/m.55836 type:complete len:220 (-) Transcript_27084:276-935(-)